jgi:hypothetical protein
MQSFLMSGGDIEGASCSVLNVVDYDWFEVAAQNCTGTGGKRS